MGCTQINEVVQILNKIRSPFEVVDVLPRSYLVPGITERFERGLAVCDWGIWSCQQKGGLCILRVDR
jgi:hypothetical protein